MYWARPLPIGTEPDTEGAVAGAGALTVAGVAGRVVAGVVAGGRLAVARVVVGAGGRFGCSMPAGSRTEEGDGAA